MSRLTIFTDRIDELVITGFGTFCVSSHIDSTRERMKSGIVLTNIGAVVRDILRCYNYLPGN